MKNDLQIKGTYVFVKNQKAFENGHRYIINQGGARSSKTHSILQLLISICLLKPNTKVTIVRRSLPLLRRTSYGEFIKLLKSMNLYSLNNHNKTSNIYTFHNDSSIEFFGVVEAKDLKGAERDILFCNEANELSYEEFFQLNIRTKYTIFMDFNPSDTTSWVYDLIKDDRAILIKSTYKDNPYLPPSQLEEYNRLINCDPNMYRIYALGEVPFASSKVYNHFRQYADDIEPEEWCYGLDFGYTHPCALVKVMWKENKIYVEELLYESNLTTTDLINRMRIIISDNKPIYCDSARPDIIEELKRFGLNARESDKKVKEGINEVRVSEIYINIESVNIWKEYKVYSYKTKGETILEEVIKENDDALDAMRYAIFSSKRTKKDLRKIRFY
jgi:phage terminase large subunit